MSVLFLTLVLYLLSVNNIKNTNFKKGFRIMQRELFILIIFNLMSIFYSTGLIARFQLF